MSIAEGSANLTGRGDFPPLKFGPGQAQHDGLVAASCLPQPGAIDLERSHSFKQSADSAPLEIGEVLADRGILYVLIDRVPYHGRKGEPLFRSDEPPAIQIENCYPYCQPHVMRSPSTDARRAHGSQTTSIWVVFPALGTPERRTIMPNLRWYRTEGENFGFEGAAPMEAFIDATHHDLTQSRATALLV